MGWLDSSGGADATDFPEWGDDEGWVPTFDVGTYECTECGKRLDRGSRADFLPAWCEETSKNTLIRRLVQIAPLTWEGDQA